MLGILKLKQYENANNSDLSNNLQFTILTTHMNDSIYSNGKEQEEFLKQFEFILKEDSIFGYLSHYAAPFTGGGEVMIPSGTCFNLYGLMRDDAIYAGPVGDCSKLADIIEKQEALKYPNLTNRYGGFICFITTEQLKTLLLEFLSGNRDELISFMDEYRKRYPDPWHMPGYEHIRK